MLIYGVSYFMFINNNQKIYKYVAQKKKPVSVRDIKRALKITEANFVEKAVLAYLNSGDFELTPEGVRLKRST